MDTENARVGGEETDATQTGYQATQGGRFAAAWEPKPSRALYISLTDGFNTVEQIIYGREGRCECSFFFSGERS